MKTIILTGALLGLATGSASAQSNVTVYGLLDTAVVLARGGPSGAFNKLESGVSNGSRLGLRGVEDLGGGTAAIFTLESGILADSGASDQNGALFGRQAFVGVKGAYGTLTAGRHYTPVFDTLTDVDPFTNNYGGAVGQLMAGEKGGTRMVNTVLYATPSVRGFSGQVAYGFGEVAGDAARSRQFGYSLGYQAGALLLRGAFNRSDNAAATDSARNTLLIAKYDFGSVAASLGYGANKGARLVDSRDYIAAMSVPLGAHGLAATLVHKSDRAATGLGANQAAMAYTYAFSTRTNLYLAYSKLSNIRFATSKFGDGDREFDIGIRHRF